MLVVAGRHTEADLAISATPVTSGVCELIKNLYEFQEQTYKSTLAT